MKNFKHLSLLFILSGIISFEAAFGAAPDSLGLKTVNGRTYIRHMVEKGETLFRLQRRYGISMGSIRLANNLSGDAVPAGQVILIPYKEHTAVSFKEYVKGSEGSEEMTNPGAEIVPSGISSEIPQSGNSEAQSSGDRIHVVQQGETLYRISQKYKITVAGLQELNNLTGTIIKIGQKLKILFPEDEGYEKYKLAPLVYNDSTNVQGLDTVIITMTDTVRIPEVAESYTWPTMNPKALADLLIHSGTHKKFWVIRESGRVGLADMGKDKANLFFGVHAFAPIGTMLEVYNPKNGKAVYVKIVDKLKSASDEPGMIVKITKKPYKYLDMKDPLSSIEVRYSIPVNE